MDTEMEVVRAPADRWLDHAPHHVDGIAIVQWPEESDRVEELDADGHPDTAARRTRCRAARHERPVHGLGAHADR